MIMWYKHWPSYFYCFPYVVVLLVVYSREQHYCAIILWMFLFQNNFLPPNLFIQADNCWRENKNRYVFAFLELLVAEQVFHEVSVDFKDHSVCFTTVFLKDEYSNNFIFINLIIWIFMCTTYNYSTSVAWFSRNAYYAPLRRKRIHTMAATTTYSPYRGHACFTNSPCLPGNR